MRTLRNGLIASLFVLAAFYSQPVEGSMQASACDDLDYLCVLNQGAPSTTHYCEEGGNVQGWERHVCDPGAQHGPPEEALLLRGELRQL